MPERYTFPFSVLLIFIFWSGVQSQDLPVIDHLPEMPDGSHVCGTHFVLELLENEDFDHQQNRSQVFPNDDPEVGDRRDFYVANFEDSQTITEYDEVEFELRAISDKSEIWVEVDEMGDDQIDEQVVEDIHREQDEQSGQESWDPDSGILEIGQELFGDPPDFEGTGRLKTLLTDIQDGWDPDEGGGFIAGYFNPVDQNSLHPNSNEGDIIYINTYPGIYWEEQEADASRRFGTIAHEYQHLIHYNYGNLNLFQNEGQSEFAELITGYDARTMHWLDETEEIDGTVEPDSGPMGLYRWRRNSSDVLMDYQRAQLLHSYVYERTNTETAAAITRASTDGKGAYEEALEEFDISWESLLRDFQITNRLNYTGTDEDSYGYTLPQLQDVRAEGIGSTHSAVLAREIAFTGEEEVELVYGGGYYSKFEDAEDLEVILEGDEHVSWAAILDDDQEVHLLEEGTHHIDGSYDEVVLVGANVMEQGNDEENPGSREYSYEFEYGVISHITDAGEQPDDFKLHDAYPNPFNPATTIRYELPEHAGVQVEVYDLQGRKITTLVDEPQQPGTHEIIFEANELSSGTYIYQINAGEWVETGKMMLIK